MSSFYRKLIKVAGGIMMAYAVYELTKILKARKMLKDLIQSGEAVESCPEYYKFPITSPFGWRKHPLTGKWSFHNGIDLALPCGTPIYAPANGIILHVDNEIGGKQIRLRTDTLSFGFSHLQQKIKPHGSYVRKGELIAYSGKSGRTTGCHLHHTIRLPDDSPVDPISVILGIWL